MEGRAHRELFSPPTRRERETIDGEKRLALRDILFGMLQACLSLQTDTEVATPSATTPGELLSFPLIYVSDYFSFVG